MCCVRAATRSTRRWPRVLMSFVAESPLTGPGAGGFMLVHTPAARTTCSTSSSRRPGSGSTRASRRRSCRSTCASPRTRSSASTSAPRRAARTARRSGSPRRSSASARPPLGDLTAAPARAAREGVEVVPMQALPVRGAAADPHARRRSARRSTRPAGACCARATRSACPSSATCSTGSAPRARLPLRGRRRARGERLGAGARRPAHREDLAAYEVIEREPARATYRGREVLTNPPPSSGGILIADALGMLERLERPRDPT